MVDSDGTLATVTFEVVEVKTSTIGLGNVVHDNSGEPLEHTTADGIVTSTTAAGNDETTNE